MKQICILLTKYSDWISSLVYYIGGQGIPTVRLRWEASRHSFTALITVALPWKQRKNTGVGESGAAASIA